MIDVLIDIMWTVFNKQYPGAEFCQVTTRSTAECF